MNVIDQYPSTLDLPPIAGGQDLTLAILIGARRRYKRGAVHHSYISFGGQVCAIGAVAREAGVSREQYDEDDIGFGTTLTSFGNMLKRAKIEQETIGATKEAIVLLNKAARQLYPESKAYRAKTWSGPLEWLNQEYARDSFGFGNRRFKSAKKAVLASYDKAIEDRVAADRHIGVIHEAKA